ncbi:MAG: hypothetical protein AMXMBFR58_35070 [Phycisphaerae bacterium]
MRLRRILRAVLAGVSLAASAVVGGCSTAPAAAPAPAPLTDAERELNARSFDAMWQTVKDRHWDPTLGGLDWEAVKVELRPRVEQAETMQEARAAMREALARLKQSHFGIIDRDVYEDVAQPGAESGDPVRAAESIVETGGDPGFDLRVVDKQAIVVRVDPGSGADRAGIKPGWVLTSVKGAPIAPLIDRLTEQFNGQEAGETMIVRGVQSRLAGPVGATIAATFLDGQDQESEKSIELEVPAGDLTKFGNLPAVYVDFTSTRLTGNIGYLRFNYFLDPGRLMPKFSAAMESFMQCDGVIIDLRGNPGGIGFMANGMSGFFVDKDGLKLGEMTTRDTTLNFVIYPRLEVYQGPLAILVDGLSVSTSEIMAGGLQDIGRVRVFGTRTAGAALPSTIERLPNGDGFQFVVANYVSASGRVLEGEGVIPDQEVAVDRATLLAGKDPVIEAAVEWIREQSRGE